LQYIDREVDKAYDSRAQTYTRMRNIAYERFDPTSSVEALIIELRKRILKIQNLKKSHSN
jgi:hypothetical protein